jgi:hypothetical protein
VVVCHDPGFYQILGENFFGFVSLEMIEIHRDLKLLNLFESFIRKHTKPSIISLEILP